jgi:hypothetical protein
MADYFTFSIKEQGPVVVNEVAPTESLVIIGPALDGPSNVPVRISGAAQAESVFGPMVYKSQYVNPVTSTADNTVSYNELLRAYHEASRAGARNIYLVRVGGVKASSKGAAALGGVNGFELVARYAGRQYNGISVAITTGAGPSSTTTGSITVTQPAIYGGTVVYNYDNSKTLDELLNMINTDNKVNTIKLVRTTGMDPFAAATSIVSGTAVLTGATYGTAAKGEDNYNGKFKMYTDLTVGGNSTFESLSDFEAEHFLLAGIYADDQVVTGSAATTTSVITDFGKFLGTVNSKTQAHGYIGVRPLYHLDPDDRDQISNHILNNWESVNPGFTDSALKWTKLGYFRSLGVIAIDPVTQESTDYGAYLSVVAGPDIRMSHSILGNYVTNPVALYAGMVTTFPSEEAMTRKTLPGTLNLRFTVTDKQIRRIVNGVGWSETTKLPGKGSLVMLRQDPDTFSPEVVYDTTFVNDTRLPFADLKSERVAFECLKRVKATLLPFIGKSFTTANKMAMEQAVRGVMNTMVEAGKLSPGGEGISYVFNLDATSPFHIANNEVYVELTLAVSSPINRIRVATTVKRPS